MPFKLIKKEFIFIRHGETAGNVAALCQGHIDFPLTRLGQEQALLSAEKIKGFLPINKVFCSDLGRAVHTAEIICDFLSIPVIDLLEGLRERRWGELEGKSNEKMFEQEAQERAGDLSFTIKDLESKSDFLKRIHAVMNSILCEQQPRHVIIGHGRFFFTLCDLLGVEPVKQIPNGSPIFCTPARVAWSIEIL